MRRTATLLLAVSLVFPAAAGRRRAAYPSAPPCAEAVLAAPFLTNDLAIDENFVYFADDVDGLYRVARNGGQQTRLARMSDGSTVFSLAVDDRSVYFAAGPFDSFLATIYSVPKSGGAPTALASGVVTPFEIVLDLDFVYWNSVGTPNDAGEYAADGKIERIRKDGTGRSTLASSLSYPLAIALDGDNVLFSETGLGIGDTSAGLRSVPKGGGTVTALFEGVPVLGIAANATDIYVGTYDGQSVSGSISAVSKATRALTRLTTETGLPLAPHVVGNEVYYFFIGSASDSIRAIGIAGGTSRAIRDGAFATQKFAVDACALYYATIDLATFAGTIRKGPR